MITGARCPSSIKLSLSLCVSVSVSDSVSLCVCLAPHARVPDVSLASLFDRLSVLLSCPERCMRARAKRTAIVSGEFSVRLVYLGQRSVWSNTAGPCVTCTRSVPPRRSCNICVSHTAHATCVPLMPEGHTAAAIDKTVPCRHVSSTCKPSIAANFCDARGLERGASRLGLRHTRVLDRGEQMPVPVGHEARCRTLSGFGHLLADALHATAGRTSRLRAVAVFARGHMCRAGSSVCSRRRRHCRLDFNRSVTARARVRGRCGVRTIGVSRSACAPPGSLISASHWSHMRRTISVRARVYVS